MYKASARRPPHPPPDVHLKRSSGQNRAALLLIKPRCLLEELGNCLLGDGQSCRAEMIREVAIAVVTRKENPSANPREFAALHESESGTSRTFRDVRSMSAVVGNSDIERAASKVPDWPSDIVGANLLGCTRRLLLELW